MSINGKLSYLLVDWMNLSYGLGNALNVICKFFVSGTCSLICTNGVVISFTFQTNLVIIIPSSNIMA